MTTYFVSTTGSDSSDGSAGSPWRTIGHAMNAALRPGDEVVVKPGTYNEQVSIAQSGTEGNNVILRSEVPGEAAIRAPSGAWNAVSINANHVTIEGFDISGGDGDGIEANNVHHIDILNNIVHDNGESGIQTNWAEFIRIEGNVTHGNASSGWFSGISLYQMRNITGDTQTQGFRTIVRNNISYDNVTEQGVHTDGNGIIIDDFNSTQTSSYPEYDYPTLVENNLVYSNGGKGIAVHWSDNVTVRNNTSWHNNLDQQNPGTWRGELSNQDSNGTTWVNNIAVADPSVNADNTAIGFYGNNANVVWQNNLSYNGRADDPSLKLDGGNTAPTAADGNLLGFDPGFVNAPVDFHLSNGSPALDSGTSTLGVASQDLDGDARVVGKIDMGAYEADSAAAQTDARYDAPIAVDGANDQAEFGTSITVTASSPFAHDPVNNSLFGGQGPIWALMPLKVGEDSTGPEDIFAQQDKMTSSFFDVSDLAVPIGMGSGTESFFHALQGDTLVSGQEEDHFCLWFVTALQPRMEVDELLAGDDAVWIEGIKYANDDVIDTDLTVDCNQTLCFSGTVKIGARSAEHVDAVNLRANTDWNSEMELEFSILDIFVEDNIPLDVLL